MNPFYYWVKSERCYNPHKNLFYMEHTYSNGLEQVTTYDEPKFKEGEMVKFPTIVKKDEPKESEQ